jgi:hypothetical protein
MKENDDRSVLKKLNMLEKGHPNVTDSRLAYIRLDLVINDTGDLMMEGQDFGSAVEETFGSDEYEYFVSVPKKYKDWLLLNLVKEVFAEKAAPSAAFMEWLEKKKIPYEFHSC